MTDRRRFGGMTKLRRWGQSSSARSGRDKEACQTSCSASELRNGDSFASLWPSLSPRETEMADTSNEKMAQKAGNLEKGN